MRVLPASYNLGDSRMFTIEVSNMAGGNVRRSVKEMLVSYSSLTAVLQNIKNCGANILSITPHQQPITNSQSSLKATVTEAPAPAAKDHDKNQSNGCQGDYRDRNQLLTHRFWGCIPMGFCFFLQVLTASGPVIPSNFAVAISDRVVHLFAANPNSSRNSRHDATTALNCFDSSACSQVVSSKWINVAT